MPTTWEPLDQMIVKVIETDRNQAPLILCLHYPNLDIYDLSPIISTIYKFSKQNYYKKSRGGVLSITVIAEGNGIGDQSSSRGRGCLHITTPLRKALIQLSPNSGSIGFLRLVKAISLAEQPSRLWLHHTPTALLYTP